MQTQLDQSISRKDDLGGCSAAGKIVPHWSVALRAAAGRLPWDRFRHGVVGSMAGSFGLSLADQVMRFALVITLGRLLGVEGYGAYACILSAVSILTVLAQLGLDRLILREVPRTSLTKDRSAMRGVIQFARKWTLAGACLIALGGGILTWSANMPATYLVALLLIPGLALMRLDLSVLRGLHHVVAGQVAEKFLQPLLFLVGIVAILLLWDQPVGILLVIILNVLSVIVACACAAYTARKYLPSETLTAPPIDNTRSWLRISLPMFFSTMAATINLQLPVLMLAWLADNAAVGLFAVASRGLLPITLVISVFSTTMSSRIAHLYFDGRHDELQQLMTRIARWQLALILPVGILLLAFGDKFLWLFGHDFLKGYAALAWLLLGQLGNAATGAIGTLLMLSGHERQTLAGLLFGISITVVLGLAFIPLQQHVGGAIAAASSVVLWNVGLSLYSIRVLGIDPTVLGLKLVKPKGSPAP